MKKSLFVLSILLIISDVFAAENVLSLKLCEKAALTHSQELQKMSNEVLAAQKGADAVGTSLYPSILLEGGAQYMDISPNIKIDGLGNADLGGSVGYYSIGAGVYWTLFDAGLRNKNYDAALKMKAAKQNQIEIVKRQLILSVRISYFKLINSLSAYELLKEQLELSLSHNTDIKRAVSAGSKSKLDEVLSDSDVLIKRKQLKTAMIMIIEAIENLNSLTGNLVRVNDSVFLKDADFNFAPYDKPEYLLEEFLSNMNLMFDFNNPQISSFEIASQYYNILSKAAFDAHYPSINVFAKTSYSVIDSQMINENKILSSAGINLSMPIYQFGRISSLSKQNEFLEQSQKISKEKISEDLNRLFNYSKYKAAVLSSQTQIHQELINQNKIAADMIYKSYLAGNIKFLDVQEMNLRVFESQFDEINTKTQLLIQLAILSSLGEIK